MPTIIRKIRLTNYLSHPDTEISLTDPCRILIDGRSGSGKTSILESIAFCLYGQGRSQNRSLVRKGASGCSVSLTLSSGDRIFTVKRGVTDKGTQSLEVAEERDGKSVGIPASSISEKQSWIEREVTGVTYPLFVNSSFWVQGNPDSFVGMSPSQRKDLVLEMAGAREIDELLDLAKKSHASAEAEARTSETEAKVHRAGIESARKSMSLIEVVDMEKAVSDRNVATKAMKESEDAMSSAKEARERSRKELEAARVEAAKHEMTAASINELRGRAADVLDLTVRASKIHDALKDIQSSKESLKSLEEADFRNTELSVANSRLESEASSIDQVTATLRGRIAALESSKKVQEGMKIDHCPAINAPCAVVAETVSKRILEISGELARIIGDVQANDARSEEARSKKKPVEPVDTAEIERLRKIVFEETSMMSELAVLQEKVRDAEAAGSKADELQKSLPDTATEILRVTDLEKRDAVLYAAVMSAEDAHRRALTDFTSATDALKSAQRSEEAMRLEKGRVAEMEAMAVQSEARSAESRVRADDLALLKDALGPNGIKAIAVGILLPSLEATANSVLSELCDLRVKLSVSRDSASGDKRVDGMFIDVVRPDGESTDFSLLSGGERNKVTIALSEAFASRSRLGFRMLDEPHDGLDNESVLAFGEALTALQSRFGQVLAVSHIPAIKGMFDDRIEIVKENGRSKVL